MKYFSFRSEITDLVKIILNTMNKGNALSEKKYTKINAFDHASVVKTITLKRKIQISLSVIFHLKDSRYPDFL